MNHVFPSECLFYISLKLLVSKFNIHTRGLNNVTENRPCHPTMSISIFQILDFWDCIGLQCL